MIVRLFALLLCCVALGLAAASDAAAPAPASAAGATIVLQLPPSMPPEAVRAMLADLAAKGARPAPRPRYPPPANSWSAPSSTAGGDRRQLCRDSVDGKRGAR